MKLKHDGPLSKFAFNCKLRPCNKAVVAEQKLDLEASFAMKGNTATKRTPSEKDVLKFAVVGPAVSGFTPKAGPPRLTLASFSSALNLSRRCAQPQLLSLRINH